MSMPLNILLLEDSIDDALLMVHQLTLDGFELVWQRADSEDAYLNHLHTGYDVILADYLMPQFDAARALELLQTRGLDVPFIIVTGTISEEVAAACMQQGAADYLLKDRLTRLGPAITKAIEARRLRHEKQQTELALRTRESYIHFLSTHIPEIIFCYHAKPEPSFAYISSAVVHLLGYQPGDYYADPNFWTQTVVPEDVRLIERMCTWGALCTVDVRILCKDGNIGWFELKLAPVYDTDGQRIGFEGVLRDITERKHMQARLQEERALLEQRVEERSTALRAMNADLTRLARAKDEFLASMSHELRTPLSAILGLSESLQEEIFGPLTAKQRQYVAGIEESGRHLLDLINDILDIAKVEYGNLRLERSSVLVEALCLSSLRLIKQSALKKHIEVSFSQDETVTMLWADERRLKQILVNLLSNAVKYTLEGGKIGLEVTWHVEQQVIRFAVWDTGIGIAQEDMGYLFKPFLQLDNARSRDAGGTGLGLALVYRMAELHGGGVSVESKLGVGSRFTVTLPQFEPAHFLQQPDHQHKSAHQHGSSETHVSYTGVVLLAEDNEHNIVVFSDYLSAHGFEVVVARCGSEAIEQAMVLRPDIILMDIQMPGMDGYETIRHIRVDESLRDTPMVALTALVMPGDQERCLAAGVNAYLSKPVRLSHLLEVVQKQLSRAGKL